MPEAEHIRVVSALVCKAILSLNIVIILAINLEPLLEVASTVDALVELGSILKVITLFGCLIFSVLAEGSRSDESCHSERFANHWTNAIIIINHQIRRLFKHYLLL